MSLRAHFAKQSPNITRRLLSQKTVLNENITGLCKLAAVAVRELTAKNTCTCGTSAGTKEYKEYQEMGKRKRRKVNVTLLHVTR